MRRAGALLLAAALALPAGGCATAGLRMFEHGASSLRLGRPYAGVRYYLRCEPEWVILPAVVDFIPCLVLDTLLLPFQALYFFSDGARAH